jgi:hypothetical protein
MPSLPHLIQVKECGTADRTAMGVPAGELSGDQAGKRRGIN